MLATTRERINKLKTEREVLLKEVAEKRAEIKKLKESYEDLLTARTVIQAASKRTQDRLVTRLEKTVTAALRSIPFKDTYDFKIEFVTRRNVSECDLLFEKGGKQMHPLDSSGYGAVDVASFALRVAYLGLQDGVRKTLILDEPFKNVSKDLHGLVAELVHELSEKHGVQIIMSTHEKDLISGADRIFLFDKETEDEPTFVKIIK